MLFLTVAVLAFHMLWGDGEGVGERWLTQLSHRHASSHCFHFLPPPSLLHALLAIPRPGTPQASWGRGAHLGVRNNSGLQLLRCLAHLLSVLRRFVEISCLLLPSSLHYFCMSLSHLALL